VTVTNISSNPVSGFTPTLGGTNAGDFAITGGTCGLGVVGLDQTCTVTVHFAPTTAGNKTASLTIAHSGTNSPTTVGLSGAAINVATPAVTLTPTSVNFASRDAGTVSAPVSVTVTNTGTANLHVTAAALIGANLNQFQLTGCTGATVAPNATCTLQVAFAPTSGGAKTAQIQLTDDAPTSPQLVSLSGTGVSASLSLSPSSLSFSAGVGGSSSKSVKITNNGTANLSISSLTITGSTTFTIASHTCTAALAPRKTCTVNVRFAPTARTTFIGALHLASNAAPATVALTGTGK
jgi:hypothetical protein